MTTLIIIFSLIAYIVIGCAICILAVKMDQIDPYDNDTEDILLFTLLWPLIGILLLAGYAYEKFYDYLCKISDKKGNANE